MWPLRRSDALKSFAPFIWLGKFYKFFLSLENKKFICVSCSFFNSKTDGDDDGDDDSDGDGDCDGEEG